ncbi:hypothetical protein [Carbonactinospora thermoautotrophica]|uniref:hypothetical protein n=1 Tax=Carbonactinospora thermoautotrophica TaxID=1469144 RepID=UPI002271D078|nr:hypothetical protein [Carbonactinospora thermoautotrophica]
MIVTRTGLTPDLAEAWDDSRHPMARDSLQVAAEGVRAASRCLARRGMLHSECEAFDLIHLRAGARRGPRGREGVEEAWYVLAGEGYVEAPAGSVSVRAGDLVLRPYRERAELLAGPGSLTLLALSVLPREVTRRLPKRVPELSEDRP